MLSVSRCLRDDAGILFIYNGAIMEISSSVASRIPDPLASHCMLALELAQKRGNDLAARYFSSALKVIGAAWAGTGGNFASFVMTSKILASFSEADKYRRLLSCFNVFTRLRREAMEELLSSDIISSTL